MTEQQILERVERMLAETKSAILATVDSSGFPRMRWMSPVFLPNETKTLYGLTAPQFQKTLDIHNHPGVEWMFQTKDLSEIITIKGKMNIIDNPALENQILEHIGRRLHIFWLLAQPVTDCVVLETVIEEARYFKPIKGEKNTIFFTS
ncbi:MAG: pyridoxamine 5'-phosphate oxidase family protein [Chitinivibrionales bacterium]|nr:pyridoxamine 5'-phosphate oxidase family protein [Chitinivibrionales bacterium]